MNLKNLNITLLLLVLLLGGMLLYLNKCVDNRKQKKDQVAFINALQDSLRIFKNKDNNNVATISVLQTESVKAFTKLNLLDEELKNLQDIVKEYSNKLKAGNSVTNALLETIAKNTNKTTVSIIKGDTIWKDSIAYIFPTYSDSIVNEWIVYRATMNKDSATLDLKINNKFSAIVGVDKGKPFIDLITENPYTSVKSLRTYQVKIPRPKKFGIGINASYSMGSNFTFQPTIGIGVQYNILRL